jgi:hypothetical protein
MVQYGYGFKQHTSKKRGEGMRITSRGIQIGIGCFVFVVGFVMITITNDSKAADTYLDPIHTHGTDYSKNDQPQTATKSKNDFPKNKEGRAYGSLADAKSPDDAPDLISATGVDGTSGYIKSSDVFGVQPKTPQEALEKQRKRVPGTRFIPLYDVDGQTVIGKFRVDDPDPNKVRGGQ